MRFQTTETIDTADIELLLQSLEHQLHSVAPEVVREGDQITAFGIGPSPRSVNMNNRSVFYADPEGAATRLTADVEFQASALLDPSAQEPAVRTKIESAIGAVKAELLARSEAAEASSLPPAETLEPLPAAVSEFPDGELYDPPASAAWEDDEPFPSSAAEAPVERSSDPMPRAVRHAVPPPRSASGANLRRYAKPLGAVALLGLVTGAYLLGRSHQSAQPNPNQVATEQMSTSPVEVSVTAEAPRPDPVPTPATAQARKPSAAEPLQRQQLRTSVPADPSLSNSAAAAPVSRPAGDLGTDLRPLLAEWAASMRSSDARKQASFYADHLDRYFLRTDVTNDFVLRDKQGFLRSGKQVRAFDLQDVAVTGGENGAAQVRLVKHYTLQTSPSNSVERSVRSELWLQRIGGEWKITGERDFR